MFGSGRRSPKFLQFPGLYVFLDVQFLFLPITSNLLGINVCTLSRAYNLRLTIVRYRRLLD